MVDTGLRKMYLCMATGRKYDSVRLAHDYIEGRFSHGDDEEFEIDGRHILLKEVVEQDELVLDILKKVNPATITNNTSVGNAFSLAQEIKSLSSRLAELEPAYRQLTTKTAGIESQNRHLTLAAQQTLDQLSTVRAEIEVLSSGKVVVSAREDAVVSFGDVAQHVAVLEKMMRDSLRTPEDLDERFADRVQRIDFLEQMYQKVGDDCRKFKQEMKSERDVLVREEAAARESLQTWLKEAQKEVGLQLRRLIDLQTASGHFRERIEERLSFSAGTYTQGHIPKFKEHPPFLIRRLFSKNTFRGEWYSWYHWLMDSLRRLRDYLRGFEAVMRCRGCVAPNEILALLKVGRSGILVTHYHFVAFSPLGCAQYLLNAQNKITVDEKIEGHNLSLWLTVIGVSFLISSNTFYCINATFGWHTVIICMLNLLCAVILWALFCKIFWRLGQSRPIFCNERPILRVPARCNLNELQKFCQALSELCGVCDLDLNKLARMPRVQIKDMVV